MGCADENDKERRLCLALLGLIDDVTEVMGVERTCAYVAEGSVLVCLGRLAYRDSQLSHIGSGRTGHTQVPQSAGPANHCQQV